MVRGPSSFARASGFGRLGQFWDSFRELSQAGTVPAHAKAPDSWGLRLAFRYSLEDCPEREVDQGQDRGQRLRDVGQGGCVQYPSHLPLLLRGDQPGSDRLGPRPTAGVELNRQVAYRAESC